jgi:hypothetical protein
MSWDKFVQVQHIDENKVTWREFKRYFLKKYLNKRYYDKKMKEFFELKLGSMTIDEYERRFLELLKYVSFIKDEQVNIKMYLSGLPLIINDKIQYDDPKTIEETIRRARFLYNQHKGGATYQKSWEDNKNNNMGQRKKGTKPPLFINNSQGQLPSKESRMTETLGKRPRHPPIQCWGCGENHMYRDFPHRGEKVNSIHNVQKVDTVEYMGRNIPRIYATLDNQQAEF